MIGSTLNHYRILGQLGQGGMGIVYSAEDTRLRRRVALKILPPEVAGDPERRERFEREARAIAALNHPNLVTIYSVEEDQGTHFFTMELIDGRSLADLVEPGGLPIGRFLDLAVPIADALAAAHRAGITHRDLKPQNVMVTHDGRVKVLDFGVARLPDAPEHAADATIESLTGTRLIGTIPNMSPEQVRGEPAGPRSDVFSLGTVLYELATGRRPFESPNAAELMSSILRDAPRPVTELNPGLPPRLARIIATCLEKDPSLRPSSAVELRDQLEGLRDEPSAPGEKPISSIAVLPFSDLSPAKDQEYFCEGMAEEIVSALARLEGLRVASRMSSSQLKAMAGDSREIGRRLGVSALLEGSVRKSGERLRITAQLVDVATGYHLWSERYDRRLEDVFSIQDEIAESIVRALRVTLAPQERLVVRKGPAASVDAYDYYLRGRHYTDQRTSRSPEFAREMYARAIAIDPEYALAYAGLADCYSLIFRLHGGDEEHLRRADAASLKAIELAPQLAESHASRGQALTLAGRFDEAESELRAAIRLDPRLFEAYYYFARLCAERGKPEEAAVLFETAARVRPEDCQSLVVLRVVYEKLGRPQDAANASRQALTRIERQLDLNPDDAGARILGANALLSLGERERGLDWTARALVLDPDGPITLYNAACAYARAGEVDAALDLLERLARSFMSPDERAWMEVDTDLDPVRDHPRFKRLFDGTEGVPRRR